MKKLKEGGLHFEVRVMRLKCKKCEFQCFTKDAMDYHKKIECAK